MIRLHTTVFNRALVDDIYSDIIDKESKVTSRLNSVYGSFAGDEQQEYLQSEYYLGELLNAKTVMDKYLLNSVNMPEYVPHMSMLESYSSDVLVPTGANGLIGASSIVKNLSQQCVLNYNISQIVPGTELYNLIYSSEDYFSEDFYNQCLKISQSMISDLLKRTCSKEAITTLLDDLYSAGIGKNSDEHTAMNELKNKFLADLYDVGRVSNLNYLMDIVRDLFMAHYTRFLELSEMVPLGMLVSVERGEGANENAPNYEKKRLMFYSFESQNYIDADILGNSGIANITSSRTNLLTTGLFSEILIKSPSVGYKINREELNGLDALSCNYLVKKGVQNGDSRAFYKSFYPLDTMLKDIFHTKPPSPLSRKYTTVCQTLGEPANSSSRMSPNVNAVSYTHLMLSDKIYTQRQFNKSSQPKDGVIAECGALFSDEYIRGAEPTVDKIYYRLSKDFCEKYTNVTESMNIVHDYQALPFIDQARLTKISNRFCTFESIFVNVLFSLIRELNELALTTDSTERCRKIDNIFNGIINVNLNRLENVEEDKLEDGWDRKGTSVKIPAMEDLILNILQKTDYFD